METKHILVLLAVLVLVLLPVSARTVMWYHNDTITLGKTYNESCHDWATANGENPDFWFARGGASGYCKVRWYWYTAPGYSYSDYSASGESTCNSDTIWSYAGDYTKDDGPTESSIADPFFYCCLNTTATCAGKFPYTYNWSGEGRPELIADFESSMTEGPATLYVLFNDTSTNVSIGASYNWSYTPATGVAWDNTSSKDPAAAFAMPGLYTISHGVADLFQSDIVTKTDYITVFNSTGEYVTTGFAAMDVPRWVQLSGATINLLDVENGTWVNTSPAATGYAEITTLSNHTIDAYASMPGYSDGDLLGSAASDLVTYPILMYPEGYANVSAGNVTLYITAHGSDDPWMEDTTVNVMYSWAGESFATYDTTDSHGMVDFVVPNNTVVSIYAWKVGYDEFLTTVNTGTGSGGDAAVYEEITLQRSYVTPTATPSVTSTTGPGGTTYPTVDTCPCNADHPECCQRKQTEMANILIEYGDELVLFFIALTIIGGVKMIGK